MDIHRCSNCHSENRVEDRFCKRCGLWLLPNCPFCNTELSETSLFCDHCGRQLNTQIGGMPQTLDSFSSGLSVTSRSRQELPPPSGLAQKGSETPTPSAATTK